MVREKQFERHLARLPGSLTVRMDDHAVGRLCRARAHKLRAALHLNDAQPAGAVGFHTRIIAERGDFNAVFPGNLENRRALLRFDLIAVYVHTNFHFVPPNPQGLRQTGRPFCTCRT